MNEIYQATVSSDNAKILLFQDIALSVCKALCSYPHYAIVRGFPAIEERSNLIDLSKSIRAVASGQSLLAIDFDNQEKVSFTQVRIDEAKAGAGGRVTQYSRTHQKLPPHTDSSYMSQPHELVAFQCIVTAQTGGKSIMVPVEDILQRIDGEVLELLKAPVYPFGNEPSPIIFGEPGNEQIRYYRAQIDQTLEAGAVPLSDKHRTAIETLDQVLEQAEQFNQFQLQAGQMVFMHNTKVLHGRTRFAAGSDRLLYRVRLHVPNLKVETQLKACLDAVSNQTQVAQSHQATEAAVNPATPHKNEKPSEANPNDAEAHLVLAKKMKRLNPVDEQLEHYRLASELATDNKVAFQAFKAYGELALEMGKFPQATKAFRRCLEIDPNDYDCGLALSSLLHDSGDGEAAKAILEQVTQKYPFVFLAQPKAKKPTILRTRGLEGSAYAIVKQADGTFSNLLRGGHFSIKHLLNKKRYNLIILNILEQNTDQLKDIPQFDLLLNTIACPDLKRESLLAAARLVDRYPDIPVINDPRRILETTRERNSLRLNMIPGVCFPKTEKLWWDGISLDGIIKEIFGLGFVFPLIIRKVGSQTGSSVALVKSEQAVRDYLQKNPANKEYYVIQFKDGRKFQNVYNKTRVFFIDRNFYPVAHLFNDSWNIHSGDRYSLMDKAPWTQYEEQSFLNDPLSYLGRENFNRLCTIRDVIGLDFFGIDFTVLPDGRLYIFELNAAMRHNFDHAKNFPYTEPHLKRISDAFEAMVQRRINLKMVNQETVTKESKNKPKEPEKEQKRAKKPVKLSLDPSCSPVDVSYPTEQAAMQVDVIQEYREFERLEENWNKVYQADPEAQFYLSWIWLSQVFTRRPKDWFILAVKSKGGSDYVAFFPLRLSFYISKRHQLFCNEILMAGRSSWADYTGFICLPEVEEEAITSLAVKLKQMYWARLDLKNLRISDKRFNLFIAPFDDSTFSYKNYPSTPEQDGIDNDICPYVELPSKFETYLQEKLSSNTRAKMRRYLRNLEGSDDLRITHSVPETFERDVDILLYFWRNRWAEIKGKKIDNMEKKFREILLQALEGGVLFMPVLWQGNTPLAALGSFIDWQKKELLHKIVGRDESFNKPSPGLILHGHSIRWAIENGLTRYDFLRGNHSYKYSYGALDHQLRNIVIRTRSRKNLNQRLDPRCIRNVLDETIELHQGRSFKKAEAGYLQILEISPNDSTVLSQYAQLLYQSKRFEESKKISLKLVMSEPKNPLGWCLLGKAQLELQKYIEGELAFRKANEISPTVNAYYGLGCTLQGQNREQEARVEFTTLLRLSPRDDEEREKQQMAREKLLENRSIIPDKGRFLTM